LVLKAGPFQGHAALEDLAPAKRVLFVDEAVEYGWIVGFGEWCVMEPGINAVQEDIDEIGAGPVALAGATEG
jgi:hypothetical protein